ncbi:MAG: M14 family zinc carboxypeptidase [Hyphomonadaceae bacterium]
MRRTLAIAAVFALGACSMLEAPPPQGICASGAFYIDIAFPAAGRHDCVIAPDASVVVSVDHEPTLTEGINPSPWFAFRINSQTARSLTVTLDYTDYKHRYRPYISRDGASWTALPDTAVVLNERETRATINLDIQPGVTWVAGQPLSPSRNNIDWTRRALAGAGFTEVEYGRSLEGRPLVGFVGGGGIDAIVALTRQHPPETTGQEAYRGFVERLITRNDSKAVAFRARHRIILAPMPNPDGVDDGHWRLNAGGQDLNRDWGKFTQPETKALSSWIVEQVGGRRVVSMMDFHSTDKTVIYAPPLDSASPTIDLLPALKTTFDSVLSSPPTWSYSHNSEGGTSKGWALEALKAPGITVELWDHEPLANARALGAAAADTLIEYFSK